jgi:hypothetical protein
MFKNQKPNYEWWAKMDSWNIKESAFLLHDLDPHEYRPIRLAEANLPLRLDEIQKTYWLLQNTRWKEKYPYHTGKGLHPLAVISEAINKELSPPKELCDLAIKRFGNTNSSTVTNSSSEKVIDANEEPLSTRERRAFLKAIGLLVKLLLESNLKNRLCVRGEKPSAFQITQLILEKADSLGMEPEGLKSMDRKITEALELLAEESVTTF